MYLTGRVVAAFCKLRVSLVGRFGALRPALSRQYRLAEFALLDAEGRDARDELNDHKKNS
jgi:hypothetical protein